MIITQPFGPNTEVRTEPPRDYSSTLTASPYPGLFFTDDFKPKEVFSPSQIETSLGCEVEWGFRYLWGLKPLEFNWLQVQAGEGQPRDRATAFGKAMHSEGESYYTTGLYDHTSAPGRALTAGLHLLPHPTQCEIIEVERGLTIDTKAIFGGIEPVKFNGFKDLVTRLKGEWYLFDYKSTKDFDYKKESEDRRSKRGFTVHGLKDDLAANTYALDVMLAQGLDSLRGRWVYFKSQGRPEAQATDLTWTKEHSKAVFQGGLIQATHLRRTMRESPSPLELDANTSHCNLYGCVYRASVGGPCTKEKSDKPLLVGTALALLDNPTHESRANIMPQLPGESVVQMKIREARATSAVQAPSPDAAPVGFAPAPQGFLQAPAPAPFQPPVFALPPVAPFQPPVFAPLPPFVAPLPQVFTPPPQIVAHVLPPEASQAPILAPLPSLPAELPPAPVKRRGRPGKAKESTETQVAADPVKVTDETGGLRTTTTTVTVFSIGETRLTVEGASAGDVADLVEFLLFTFA